MAAYAYAINIDYNKKVVKSEKRHTLYEFDKYSPDELAKMIEGRKVSFENGEDLSGLITMVVHYERPETDVEQKSRIKKEEAYMKRYNELNGKR